MKGRIWLLAALAAVAALLVGPAIAGAGAPLVSSPDNETSTAWFVQFAGAPTASGGSANAEQSERQSFYANAAALGVDVTERQSFGTLWNGVSVNVPLSQEGKLMSLPGVQALYPVREMQIPPDQTAATLPSDVGSNPMIGVDPNAGGVGRLDGRGIKVAVIDSGIDYRNPDLGGCFGRGCKVAGGLDLVGNSYDDTPSDALFQPVPHPSRDPAPCDPNLADANVAAGKAARSVAGHGTHVAGIIGAKASDSNGVTGVAPGVTLLAFKVFGCNGGTATDNVVHALELSWLAGANVVNMSLGDDYQSWPGSPDAQVSDFLARHGVVVVAAAGNAGGVGTALLSNGSPSVGNDVVSVASVDNKKPFLPYFALADGSRYGFFVAAGAPAPATSGGAPVAVVPAPASGSACSALAPGSLTGQIALVRRGVCTFHDKAINVQNAGAVGMVLYNNQLGFVNPTVAGTPPVTIPVVSVSDVEGAAIRAAVAAGNGTLTWTPNSDYFSNPSGGLVASSSSWGPNAELTLKPDVAAPGGLIRSTWPITQFGGHNVISGTSMATPHVAGAAAILLEAGKPYNQVRDWLSNYAEPAVWSGSPGAGLLESPLREGAGLIKVDRSATATVLVQPAKLSLGEGLGGVRTLAITNSGDSAVTYDLTARSAISPFPNSSAWPNAFGFDLGEETVTFSPSHVTVPAHSRAAVTTTISVGPTAPDGELYDGYIQLIPSDGGNAVTVPYAGFKGDYQAQTLLTHPVESFGTLPALVHLLADGTLKDVTAPGETFTMAGSDLPILLYHLNLPARKLDVRILNADGTPIRGDQSLAVEQQFLPRNDAQGSFFEFDWDGTRVPDEGEARRRTVPNGTYMLQLSVLKPLGNERNAADWETFTTVPFTIARASSPSGNGDDNNDNGGHRH